MITVVLAGALSKMERSITVSILKVDHHISGSTNSIVSIVAHVKLSKRGWCLIPLIARMAFFLARVSFDGLRKNWRLFVIRGKEDEDGFRPNLKKNSSTVRYKILISPGKK